MNLTIFLGFFKKLKYMYDIFLNNLFVCINNIKGKIKKYIFNL